MTVWSAARIAALAFVGSASLGIAHADPSTVEEAVDENGARTCHHLSEELTGNVSHDEQVFMAEIDRVQDFYGMSGRDASAAVGDMIGKDCPQFGPNLDAVAHSMPDS